MMNTQLVEIQPRELKFIFELKKQSSCSLRLTNNTHNYVAFKVKTTSPKKYCVRPNVGVIKPKSTLDFTVTMQAQLLAPPDMVCKDKFLIQTTAVPVGTADEDIRTSTFAKDDGRYVQENKLRVTLISPPNSPVLSPINGTLKQGPAYEASIRKDPLLNRVEIFTPPPMVARNMEGSKIVNGEELKPPMRRDVPNGEELKPAKDAELKPRKDVVNMEELKPAKDADLESRKDVVNSEELKPAKDTELKSRTEFINSGELKPAKDAELKSRTDFINGGELKPAKDAESKTRKDVFNSEELKPAKDAELEPSKDVVYSEVLKPEKDRELNLTEEVVNSEALQPTNDTESKLMKNVEFKTNKADESLKVVIEEMKSELNDLESKLSQAEVIISKLTEERRLNSKEKKTLQRELEVLRSKGVVRNVQVGFPLLFVCLVAFVSFMLGSRLYRLLLP